MIKSVGMISPPTDNLYKFMAISGMLLIVFTGHTYWATYDSIETKLEASETNAELWSAESDDFNSSIALSRDDLDKVKKEIDNTPQITHEQRLKRLAPFLKQTEQFHEALISLGEKKIRLKGSTKEIKRLAIQAVFLSIFSLILFLIGTFLSFFGFKNWYYKIQKFEDMKIFKEATDATTK